MGRKKSKDIKPNQLIKPSNSHNIILNPPSSHSHIKNLISFVSTFPNVKNVICFIFANQSSEPTKFLSIYPLANNQYKSFGLYYNEAIVNKQKTIMIGLNKSFFDLTHGSDKVSLTDKHLILMYLLKKIESVKFVLCFDKNAIMQSSFLIVKNTFNRLLSTLNMENIKNYQKSFIILAIHPQKENVQEFEKICEARFNKSIKEKTFFQQNYIFIKEIIDDIFGSSNKSQIRLFKFENKIFENQVDKYREEFQRIIKLTQPIQLKCRNSIGDKFLETLKQKSLKWNIFNEEYKIEEKFVNTQDSQTSNKIGDGSSLQLSGIQKIFLLWDNFFEQLVKFIIKKLTHGAASFQGIKVKGQFLMQKPSDKYQFQKRVHNNVMEKNIQINSPQIYDVLSQLMEYLRHNIIEYQKINQIGSAEEQSKVRLKFLRSQLKKFLGILYDCQILNINSQEKVVHDFFMVFDQLLQVWSQIQDPEYKIDSSEIHTFFTQNDLMMKPLVNIPFIKNNLLQIAIAIFIRQLQIEVTKTQNGQYVKLSCWQPSVRKIKRIIDEEKKYVLFQNVRLSKIISQYELILQKIKTESLSSKPYTGLKFIIRTLRKQVNPLSNVSLVDNFAKLLLQYINQYKIKTPLEVTTKIIQLLQLNLFDNLKLISHIYQTQIYRIYLNARQVRRQLDETQNEFILRYSMVLVRLGFLQKLRELAYQIATIDKQLSKKMICKTLIKNGSKLQLELIQKDNTKWSEHLTPQQQRKKQILSDSIVQTVQTLERFLIGSKIAQDQIINEENQLIDL